MKNKHAISLKQAADKYDAWHSNAFSDDEEMLKFGKQDYEDLLSIAGMIENGEDSKKIANAMRRLDTAVRDVIPDSAYYAYTEF
jgi:Ser/Thr protein kinase RdoA (MazF antagonist)